ncbi:MAG: hypothetical protein C0490_20245 [Marivirga sp.]|nr:hypothetical protein [Marivirga sp.]
MMFEISKNFASRQIQRIPGKLYRMISPQRNVAFLFLEKWPSILSQFGPSDQKETTIKIAVDNPLVMKIFGF